MRKLTSRQLQRLRSIAAASLKLPKPDRPDLGSAPEDLIVALGHDALEGEDEDEDERRALLETYRRTALKPGDVDPFASLGRAAAVNLQRSDSRRSADPAAATTSRMASNGGAGRGDRRDRPAARRGRRWTQTVAMDGKRGPGSVNVGHGTPNEGFGDFSLPATNSYSGASQKYSASAPPNFWTRDPGIVR